MRTMAYLRRRRGEPTEVDCLEHEAGLMGCGPSHNFSSKCCRPTEQTGVVGRVARGWSGVNQAKIYHIYGIVRILYLQCVL